MIQLNFGFGELEAEFWRLLFVMTRTGAAMLAAPIFGAGSVPPQLRVIAAGAIAVMICAWTPVAAPPALLSLEGMLDGFTQRKNVTVNLNMPPPAVGAVA